MCADCVSAAHRAHPERVDDGDHLQRWTHPNPPARGGIHPLPPTTGTIFPLDYTTIKFYVYIYCYFTLFFLLNLFRER